MKLASQYGAVLDLACGSGRNGLYLARKGLPVVFADQDQEKLARLDEIISKEQLDAKTWLVDLETGHPLEGKQFGAIIVFRYLYRPLFAAIRDSIVPSGLIVYETFNVGQRAYGRPHNPDFLLRENELATEFRNWQVLHQFEGVVSKPQSAISQLVARQ
ncbi:SAM-dependent methyltransferase [Photobacterium proteolyticum]|uniref:SAM-dependent methyltransferase n=1 Tax=Photobacterium proteolyticum TaxID=1903952 RepID=A0A1Q9H1A6_9GAMM|nr:SAM-dependent methyltransferase [Photobacterium proteolyticum]